METSTLWKRTLGSSGNDRSVERLVESLRNVRQRADHLYRSHRVHAPRLDHP